MPCKGIAYCNSSKTFFFLFSPSIKVYQPRKATGNPFSLFTDRNQKLVPGDTGLKTNPLQLLFDRYEHFYCAGKLETRPKTNCQTALASLEKAASFPSEHHFSPFYCHWKCEIVAFFFFPQILSTIYSLIWECKQAIVTRWMSMR